MSQGEAQEVERLPLLPSRAPDAHKGDFGRVLVVAGSPGMTGAGCLAALGAQRAGAGLVTLALPAGLHLVAEVKLTSVMSRPLPDPDGPVVGGQAADRVLQWASEFTVVVLGPGLGRRPATADAVRRLVGELPLPTVLDADGLNALAGATDVLQGAPAPRLLTPHPGEMSRLVGRGVADIQAGRVQAAREFAVRHGVVVALKGAGTVVTDGRCVYVNPTGNPGMATGGTGDVLTGMAAGLLGQGLSPFQAMQLAVFTHGLAGDVAAARRGRLSLTAEDVLETVPEVFRLLESYAEPPLPGAVAARLSGG